MVDSRWWIKHGVFDCRVAMVTCLRSRCSLWLKYKGSSDIMVYRPQVCVKCARTMAHNGKEVNIAFHGIDTSYKRNKKTEGLVLV